MIKDFRQQYEVDYFKIFTAVVKSMSYKIIFALAAHYDLIVHQMDVKSTFLNDELDEKIYMKLLNEFKNSEEDENVVCRLLKFIYELKQSSHI